MRILGSVLAVAALCLLLAGNASATATGWVTMSFYNVSPGEGVSYSVDPAGPLPLRTGSTTAGVYNQKVYLTQGYGNIVDQEATKLITSLGSADGGTGTGTWAYASTFCSDILQSATGTWLRYDIYTPEAAPIGGSQNPMGPTKAADLRKLFKLYGDYGVGNLDWGDVGNTPTTAEKNEQSAAFQAAVWEIIYETAASYTVTADAFKITSGNASKTLADYWLTHLGDVDPCIGLRVLVRENQQDFSIVVPGVGRDPIPEPVTMAGLMLGIGGLSGYIRRRRRA